MALAMKTDEMQVGDFYSERDENGNAVAIVRMGLGLGGTSPLETWARIPAPTGEHTWADTNERADVMVAALNNNGLAAIAVKPLVWDHTDRDFWLSDTPMTDYGVKRTRDGKFELNIDGKVFASLDAAQAAAQADYNFRIRSSLGTPSGMPEAGSDQAAEALAELERARNELLKRAQTAERNLRDTTAAFTRERAEHMKSMNARKADSEKIETLITLIRDGLEERDHGEQMSDAWQSRAQAALSEVIGSKP